MIAFPKKPKKKLTKLQRKKLRPDGYCARPRCTKPIVHIGRCTTHAKEHLDDLQRPLVIEPGSVCEAADWHKDIFPCGGPLQVNHKIEREYLLTRWLPENVMSGCRDLNMWAFHHKREWARMLKDWEGVEAYERLDRLALSKAKPDYEETLQNLSGERRLGMGSQVA